MSRKKSKKTIKREQDLEWKNKVKARDNFTCQICKKKVSGLNCHAHHIITKQIKELQYDLMNGITLCYQHHKVGKFSPHQNALWFANWLKINKPEQYKYSMNKLQELDDEKNKRLGRLQPTNEVKNTSKKIGYSNCNCNVGFSGGIVLDPFFGAGTTGLVALKQNKKFIGIELNKEYIEIAKKRLKPFLEQTKL